MASSSSEPADRFSSMRAAPARKASAARSGSLVHRHEHQPGRRIELSHLTRGVESVEQRHRDIDDDDVRLVLPHRRDHRPSVADMADHLAHRREQRLERFDDKCVVVCDEHTWLHHKLSQRQSCISCTPRSGVRRSAPGIENSTGACHCITVPRHRSRSCRRVATRSGTTAPADADNAIGPDSATAIFHVCGACAPGRQAVRASRGLGTRVRTSAQTSIIASLSHGTKPTAAGSSVRALDAPRQQWRRRARAVSAPKAHAHVNIR